MWIRAFIDVVSSRAFVAGVALALLVALALPAPAQTVAAGAQAGAVDLENAPERVGRLAVAEGDVQAWNDQRRAWESAVVNLPATSRSAFWTGNGARAEVTVGSAALRIDSQSQANFVRLDDGGTDVDVPRGSVEIRTRAAGEPTWQVAARDSVVALASPGLYRVDVDPSRGLMTVQAFEGAASYTGAGQAIEIAAGQRVVIDLRTHLVTTRSGPIRNAFDDWNAMRDREQDRLAAYRYVSPEMTGVESLDSAGYWTEDPGYGALWYPYGVTAGWEPYRYGRWVWVSPWGWTWVDDMPWGFAPFHYGSWVWVNSVWAWAPGRYAHRPVFSPAMAGVHGPAGRIPPMPRLGAPGFAHAPGTGWRGTAPVGVAGAPGAGLPHAGFAGAGRPVPPASIPALNAPRFTPPAARLPAPSFPSGRSPGVPAMPPGRVSQFGASPALPGRFVAAPQGAPAPSQGFPQGPRHAAPAIAGPGAAVGRAAWGGGQPAFARAPAPAGGFGSGHGFVAPAGGGFGGGHGYSAPAGGGFGGGQGFSAPAGGGHRGGGGGGIRGGGGGHR